MVQSPDWVLSNDNPTGNCSMLQWSCLGEKHTHASIHSISIVFFCSFFLRNPIRKVGSCHVAITLKCINLTSVIVFTRCSTYCTLCQIISIISIILSRIFSLFSSFDCVISLLLGRCEKDLHTLLLVAKLKGDPLQRIVRFL